MQIQTQLANHVAAVGPAVLVGIACGLLGTVFTILNIKVVRLRDTIIQVCTLYLVPCATLPLPCTAPSHADSFLAACCTCSPKPCNAVLQSLLTAVLLYLTLSLNLESCTCRAPCCPAWGCEPGSHVPHKTSKLGADCNTASSTACAHYAYA